VSPLWPSLTNAPERLGCPLLFPYRHIGTRLAFSLYLPVELPESLRGWFIFPLLFFRRAASLPFKLLLYFPPSCGGLPNSHPSNSLDSSGCSYDLGSSLASCPFLDLFQNYEGVSSIFLFVFFFPAAGPTRVFIRTRHFFCLPRGWHNDIFPFLPLRFSLVVFFIILPTLSDPPCSTMVTFLHPFFINLSLFYAFPPLLLVFLLFPYILSFIATFLIICYDYLPVQLENRPFPSIEPP